MKPQPAFDTYAADYDASFTHSHIGRWQRAQVWKALASYLDKPKRILEVNCGTGVDALWLAAQGQTVLATDISPRMIEICRQKLKHQTPAGKIDFQVADFLQISTLAQGESFDLIFSNFGGLNCVDEKVTRQFSEICGQLLRPGGHIFLVYISKSCLWERLYFRYRGEKEKATRRQTNGPVVSKVEGQAVPIWYYDVAQLKRLYSDSFVCIHQFPIGLFVPPSYLEDWFENKAYLLRGLGQLDWWLRWKRWADYGDHVGVVMERRV